MQQNKLKKELSIKEYIILIFLVLIIEIGLILVPFILFPGVLFIMAPIAIIYINWDLKPTVISLLISFLVIGVLFGPTLAFSFTFLVHIMGITLGYCIKKHVKTSRTILYIVIAILLAILASIFFVGVSTKGGLIDIYNQINSIAIMTKDYFKGVRELYVSVGVSKDQLAVIDTFISGISADAFIIALPGTLIWISFITAVLGYFLSGKILKGQNYSIGKPDPIETVYVDNRIAGIVLILVCLGIILNVKNIAMGLYISSFAQTLMYIIFLIDGFAAYVYFLKNKLRFNTKYLIVILVLVILLQMEIFFIIIGIIDAVIDFRKLDPNRLFKR